MAADGCGTRVLRALEQAALWLRKPAIRLLGSVRAAVALQAVLVGGYVLIIGCFYFRDLWDYRSVRILITTNAAFAHITGIMNIAVLFGILVRNNTVLKYIVCAAMALYSVCLPLSISAIIGGIYEEYFETTSLETPRIALCLLHLGLMYCLLVELREESSAGAKTPPPPEGWLKNNMAHQATPPLSGEEVLLKIDSTHPAFFAPAAAPVHQPPASYGPLSSSEA